MKLPQQNRTLSAIVGSYPKPAYVYPDTGRDLLDSFGFGLEQRRKEVGSKEFDSLLDKAARQAIADQNDASIDLITDGEERRGHYVIHIVSKLGGIDSRHLKPISMRGGTSQQQAPSVVGKITRPRPLLLEEFRFTQKYAKGTAKIGLPGPTTVADCVADEYYGDKKRLAYDYAAAIRDEVGELIDVGCRVIQFDDPVLLRYPDEAQAWGLDALQACFKGFEDQATFIVHICCGYPNKPLERQGVSYKANADYYRDILSWLADSKLDAVSIEGAQSKLDVSVLPAIGDKTIMLGVLDVGEEAVESVESLVARGKEALKFIKPDQLILAPDCGMINLSRDAAKQKLRNLAEATRELNRNL